MSNIHEGEFRQLIEVKDLGKIRVKDLFDQVTPVRSDLDQGNRDHEALAQKELCLYKVELSDGTIELTAFAPAVDGKQINGLLYFPAPSRVFGYDTKDILDDWRDLYRKPEHVERLKAHRTFIPNWSVFEKERIQLWTAIYASRKNAKMPPKNYFIPVMAWKVLPDGKREWVIEKNKLASLDEMKKTHLAKGLSAEQSQYSLLVGSLFAASFSPEKTSKWPKELNYHLKEEGGTNNMGATQALPLVLAKSAELLDSAFVIKLEEKMGLPDAPRQVILPPVTPDEELKLLPSKTFGASPIPEYAPGIAAPWLDLIEQNLPSLLPEEIADVAVGLVLQTYSAMVLNGDFDAENSFDILYPTFSETILEETDTPEKAAEVFLPPEHVENKRNWMKFYLLIIEKMKDDEMISKETFDVWHSIIVAYIKNNNIPLI